MLPAALPTTTPAWAISLPRQLRVGVVFLAYGLITIGLICNLIAMKFYPLSKEKMAEIQDEIVKIKAKAMAEA